ncbi:MAG TPA: hypothetical protein VEI02_11445 [Planctomycetota bacterium]|nr:hypothetical protein [Planctomycetota bacterium]
MNAVRHLAAGVVVAAICAHAPAQGLVQSLPPGFETATTGNNDTNPFGVSYPSTAIQGQIHQYCFDTSFFNYKGLMRINSVSFRQLQGVSAIGGTANQVTIALTSSPVDMQLLSTTLSSNHGADYTTCFTGSITFPAGVAPVGGTLVPVPLTTPFVYDPRLGKDLLVEVITADVNQQSISPIEVSFGPARTQANRLSATAVTGNTGLVTAALLLIDYTPLPFLQATTSGGGVGDLFVSLTEFPPAMTRGWTLISTDATHPVDTGPFLGIWPTQTLWDVLSFTPSFGNPLAWITGVPPGFFPTTPLTVPAGTLSFLNGQTWDFVILGTDAFGSYVGRSNVVRVQW